MYQAKSLEPWRLSRYGVPVAGSKCQARYSDMAASKMSEHSRARQGYSTYKYIHINNTYLETNPTEILGI